MQFQSGCLKDRPKSFVFPTCQEKKQDSIIFFSIPCIINKNMFDRTRLKTHKILPQTRESVVKRRERLANYNRQLFSSQSCRTFVPSSVSTAPDQPRVHSAMQTRTRNQPTQSSSSLKIAIVKIDPFTQPKKCHDRSQSPLSVIRSRSRCSQEESQSLRKFPIRVNFLKKGSSVDRGIMKNILASKTNTNACLLAQSYVDAPQNCQIATIMHAQIPKGLKDVIGAEEMLRMSHIMTGVQFKTISLHDRVKQVLLQHKRTSSLPQPIQQEQLLTLKSIKRW